MPLDFPSSPTLNQVYTLGNKSWVWNGSGWEVQRPYGIYGNFNINTLSSSAGTGGGSSSFNGTAYRFTLSYPPSTAQQLIVSVNGVVQRPNEGTAQPAEGFAVDGADIVFSSPPATGASFFIVTIGTTVNIGEPSNNTVTSAKIVDGSIVDADVNAAAAIAGTKVSPNFGSQNVLTTGTSTAASFIPSSSTIPSNGVYLPAANTLGLATNSTQRITINTNGNVGIGSNIPRANLEVVNGSTNTAGEIVYSAYVVGSTVNSSEGILTVQSNDAVAANKGGSIAFGGRAVSASTAGANWSFINGYKENASSSDYAGYLAFATRTGAGVVNERFRCDSFGRLLVGTSTSPSAGQGQYARFAVQGNTAGTNAGILNVQNTIASSSIAQGDDIGFINFTGNDGNTFAWIRATADAATGAGDYPGRLVFSTTADGAIAPTERLKIDSSGNVNIVNGNIVIGTAGKGIDFSATTDGSGTASNELLADYEEGSWTPRLSGTSGGNYTPGSNNVGRYVKVGKVVTASATVHWTGVVTAYTGLFTITGLPYAALNVTDYRAAAIVPGQSVGIYASGSYNTIGAGIDWNNTFVYVVMKNEAITSGVNYSHSPNVLSSGVIYGLAITYITN